MLQFAPCESLQGLFSASWPGRGVDGENEFQHQNYMYTVFSIISMYLKQALEVLESKGDYKVQKQAGFDIATLKAKIACLTSQPKKQQVKQASGTSTSRLAWLGTGPLGF